MLLCLEIEHRRRAVAAHFDICLFVRAHGYVGFGLIGQSRKHLAQGLGQIPFHLFAALQGAFQFSHFGDQIGGVLAFGFRGADLFRQLVSAILNFLQAGPIGPGLYIPGQDVPRLWGNPAGSQTGIKGIGIVADPA